MDCKHDKTTLKYSEDHDVHYCEECNEWLNSDCKDPDCEYCADRPDKPRSE